MTSRFLAGAVAGFMLSLGILALLSGGSTVHGPEVLTQSQMTTSTIPSARIATADFQSMLPPETTTTTVAPVASIPEETTTTSAAVTETTGTTTSGTTGTTTAPTTTTMAGSSNSSYEASFLALINDHRAANGLPALTRDGALDSEARAWSELMSAEGSIFHSDLSRLFGPWSIVGENVAVGGSVTSIFNALVASPGHNENMLSASYTACGIGVWVDADGTIWTTHLFAG